MCLETLSAQTDSSHIHISVNGICVHSVANQLLYFFRSIPVRTGKHGRLHVSNLTFSLFTPFLFVLLGFGQWGMWMMWRHRMELAWMGLSFMTVSTGMLVQMFTRSWPLTLHVLAFTGLYVAATASSALALAHRLRVQMPWVLAGLVVGTIFCAQVWFSAVQPDLSVRVVVLSVMALVLMGLPLLHWQRMQPRNRFDRYLRWLYVLCITSNIARTLLQLPETQGAVPGSFMQSDFWLVLHLFAMLTGMAMAGCLFFAVLRDVLDQLQSERNTDALTHLLNRRGWQARLDQLQTSPLHSGALLMMDIDHFKQINDQLGHARGDQVLQQVAQLVQQQVRGHDLVCRYGGEEFMVLLLDVDMPMATQVAERIRAKVEEAKLACLDSQPLTISIGIAALARVNPSSIQAAIEAADGQLYAAKRAGRNQVALAV